MMLSALQALIKWADVITALVSYQDMNPHDRAALKLALRDLKDAAHRLEEHDGEDRATGQAPGPDG